MNTGLPLCKEYVRNSNDPVRLSHQNAVGTTTCFFFSVAYHWTKNREAKVAFASQPTISQASHRMPRKFPLCQRRFARKSIIAGAFSPTLRRLTNEFPAR